MSRVVRNVAGPTDNPLAVMVSGWRSHSSGTLVGFFSASLPSGLVLHELMLHYRDGSWWISFPSKPVLGPDGGALRDERGKVRYSKPLIEFSSRQAKDRFTEQVLTALRQTHPEIFAAEAAA
jgi:hypothetical protein